MQHVELFPWQARTLQVQYIARRGKWVISTFGGKGFAVHTWISSGSSVGKRHTANCSSSTVSSEVCQQAIILEGALRTSIAVNTFRVSKMRMPVAVLKIQGKDRF